jgi:hypothetical protein
VRAREFGVFAPRRDPLTQNKTFALRSASFATNLH